MESQDDYPTPAVMAPGVICYKDRPYSWDYGAKNDDPTLCFHCEIS